MKYFKLLALLVIPFFPLLAEAEAPSYTIVEDENPLEIKTPSMQGIETEKIILANGMKVYLISDKEAQQSGAALCVNVGSWNDENFPGIAHFCEHMLFMGSEKYPDENGYDQCIADGAGQKNAFTSANKTNHIFTVSHSKFEDALDRFSRFFIDPLFKQDAMEREICAVDEEYKKDTQNDGWRFNYVKKALGNKEHPHNRFTCGNKATIEKIGREDLLSWYKEHYSSDKMDLCVYSEKDLEELRELVVKTFSLVPNNNRAKAPIPYMPMFSEKMKGGVLQYQSISDQKKLILEWEIQNNKPQLEDAGYLIEYTLGHHLNGGLYHTLKEKDLIVDISVSLSNNVKDHLHFQIFLMLTEKGIQNVDKIIEHIFASIHKLKTEGIPQYIHEDYTNKLKAGYEWQSRSNTFSTLSNIAMTLSTEDFSTYPYNGMMLNEFDPGCCKEFLDNLCPSQALFSVWSQFQEEESIFKEKEPWYGASYNFFPLEKELLDKWKNLPAHPNSIFPEKNPFTLKDVELFSAKLPPLVQKDEKGICYLHIDKEYFVPTVQLNIDIKSPAIDGNIKSYVLANLYASYVSTKTMHLRAQGIFSNISSSIYHQPFKIGMYINAYHEQIHPYTKQLLIDINNIEFNEELFLSLKKETVIAYENFAYASPYQKGIQAIHTITKDEFFSHEAIRETLQGITLDDLKDFHQKLFQKNYLEVFISGNTSLNKARNLYQEVLDNVSGKTYDPLNHPKSQFISSYNDFDDKPLQIDESTLAKGDAMVLFLDQGEYDHYKSATNSILGEVLSEAFFNELRTNQQTGYIVACPSTCYKKRLSQFFFIQSHAYEPKDLLERTYTFIHEFYSNLEEIIPEEKFLQIKQSLQEAMNKPCKTLNELSNNLYTMIFVNEENYDYQEEQMEAFDDLDYEMFIKTSKELLSLDSPERRIEVLVYGKRDEINAKEPITINEE